MELIDKARAAAGPEFTEFTKVEVITPEMPYDLGRFLALNPSTGELVEISFSSDQNTAPRLRPLPDEEAEHVMKSGAFDGQQTR